MYFSIGDLGREWTDLNKHQALSRPKCPVVAKDVRMDLLRRVNVFNPFEYLSKLAHLMKEY